MKRLFLQYICSALFILVNFGILGALELEITAGLNGMTFHPDKTRALTETGEVFTPYPYGLANLSLKHDVTESIFLNVNLVRDNILQNSLDVKLTSRTDRFKFEFGPFLGVTDDFEIPDIGVIGELELTFPGIFFVSISGSSTLGAEFDFFSANSRETAGAKAGFWIGNFIISVSANYKNLTRQKNEYLIVSNTLIKFNAGLDFYAKNFGVSGSIFGGYQIYKSEYRRGTLLDSDELSAWYAGAQFNWQITQPLQIKLGFELPVKNMPVKPLKITEDFMLLSKIYAGFVYSFNDIGIEK
ncbi:MAG: hypothetical protein FWB77_00395 [Treponema sp.]|nr:hypothetical protein [Treponema sp.]